MEFHLLNKLGAVAAVTLVVYLVMKVFDMQGRGVLPLAFQSTYEGRMFLAEMLLGVIAPIIMFLIPRIRNNHSGLFIAALLVVLGFVMNRINVSITGMDRASGVNYFPSWMELAVTASIIAMGFLLFGLAVKYLEVFPTEEMNEIAGGRLAELPATAALRQPLRSATTLAFVLGCLFLFGAVALSYDGIRLRVPTESPVEQAAVNIDQPVQNLSVPDRISIKMGTSSPGQVTFDHKKHIDTHHPDCTTCHEGKFRFLKTSADLTPGKKMYYCGDCHDGIKAVAITDKARCESCHAPK
jgi:c(7)-type cytochrome triheme protein